MKSIPFASVALALVLTLAQMQAADPAASIPTEGKPNTICPISGKPVNPAITMEYEGLTYAFAENVCRTKFKTAREDSLYQKLGGKAAIDVAVEAFYVKILADNRVKHFFDDINSTRAVPHP